MNKINLLTISKADKAKKKAKANKIRLENPLATTEKEYKSHTVKVVYTYVLKDIVRNIYKIGKTANPHDRFKNLCIRGKIYPIALVAQDVEKLLHTTYAENRMKHPDFTDNGASEWFRSGGKFDTFVSSVDKGTVIPYITLHVLVCDLIESGKLLVSDTNTEWELAQSNYSYYMIGLEILAMLGYIKRGRNLIVTEDPENIFILGTKISVSEAVIDSIKEKHTMTVSTTADSRILKENKSDTSRLRRIDLKSKDFHSEVFLLLN